MVVIIKIVAIVAMLFMYHEVCVQGLTCLCNQQQSCDDTGHCQISNGTCVNVTQPGSVQRYCVAQGAGAPPQNNCMPSTTGVPQIICYCNNTDNCNGNVTIGAINIAVNTDISTNTTDSTTSTTSTTTSTTHSTVGNFMSTTTNGNWIQYSIYVLLVSLVFVLLL